MKYIKLFPNVSEYELFKASDTYLLPNLSLCKSDGKIYHQRPSPKNIITYTAPSEIQIDEYVADSNIYSHQFSEGVGTIIFENDITAIYDYAFYNCSGLTSIEIPDSVTTIGNYAFNNCSGLTSIELPDAVTTIGGGAFYNCSNLSDVIIGSGVTTIGDGAFSSCYGLTSIEIPDSVTTIGDGAFSSCYGLTSIEIPNSVTTIGGSAFYNCSNLSNVTIGSGVTTIGNDAFSGCYGLTSIEIPNSVTTIGEYAFSGCYRLTSIEIPDSVTTIGYGAFNGCKCELIINSKIVETDYTDETALFRGSEFEKITFIGDIEKIGDYVFYNCKGLTSIEIPDSVTTIGNYAFDESNCCKIICKPLNAPSLGSVGFHRNDGILYIPYGSDYSSWLSKLGNGWTTEHIYTPSTYYDLSITANNVIGNKTNTTINWTCMSDGYYYPDTFVTGIQLSGTETSSDFPQNTSKTESVEREITFEYQGLTATTTITHDMWIDMSYMIDLNNQWRLSDTVLPPDSSTYDGVYESFSNKGVDNSAAFMYIDIEGYDEFTMYVRSYGEYNYDYVVVSQLDKSLAKNTTSGSNVKTTTRSSSSSTPYIEVKFTNIDRGRHRITVMYRKDGSTSSGTDQGYVMIPKNQL